MLSNVETVFPIVVIALVLWLIGLTVVFYRLLSHYKRIAKRVSEGDLVKLVRKLIDTEEKNSMQMRSLLKEIERIDKRLKKPLQKVSTLRYNPFSNMGGDHSFTTVLLDEEDNGFLVTNLHTRDRTRVYMKPIVGGESELKLSKEEEKVLKNAKGKKLL